MFQPPPLRPPFIRPTRFKRLRLLCASILLSGILSASMQGAEAPVDFHSQIRPILVSYCFRCHSSVKQEGELRLDSAAAIQRGGAGGAVLVPRQADQSRLLHAVSQTGDLKMPPEGKSLTPQQVELLRRWIEQGAEFGDESALQKHWAYEPPQRTIPPESDRSSWLRQPIDAFIAQKHQQLGLVPAPAATPHTFIRRLYLDLVGYPPSAAEVQSFVEDPLPDAIDRVADQLLASPRYGERWGRHWMDVWRYSDWDGYGAEVRESQPHIWRWRDWIVESLNSDRGYDQMIVEMLAGDELAPHDPQTLRATGFLARNWFRFNRNVWLDNTIEHTGKAFLGMTFNCARCHDHMYDPIAQNEYYQLRAIFEPHEVRIDSVAGQPDTTKDGVVRVFDAQLAAPTFPFVRGDEKQPNKDQPLPPGLPQLFGNQAWSAETVSLKPADYYPGSRPAAQDEVLQASKKTVEQSQAALATAEKNQRDSQGKLESFLAKASEKPSTEPPAVPKEILNDDFSKLHADLWTVMGGTWEVRDGHLTQTEAKVEMCAIVSSVAPPKDFLLKLRYRPLGGNQWKSTGISFDAQGVRDWNSVYASAYADGPKLQVAIRRGGQDEYPPGNALKNLPIELNRPHELQIAVRDNLINVFFDGTLQLAYRLPSRPADGKLAIWAFDAITELHQFQVTELPSNMGLAETVGGPLLVGGALSEASLRKELKQSELAVALARKSLAVSEAQSKSVLARVEADRVVYRSSDAPPIEQASIQERSLAAAKAEREANLTQAELAVMQAEQKLETAKQSLVPNDDKSAKAVTDAETALTNARKAVETAQMALQQPTDNYTRFGPMYPPTSSGRRLALARWIASGKNPLTARVAANHLWLRHFSAPLVPTVFEFGKNGKPPSHPQLLDWLATELIRGDWRMKPLHRRMVTSAAYQLASAVDESTKPNLAVDRDNVYLWKMNSHRMEAELVRDSTLRVSGQLWLAASGPDLDPNTGLTVPRRSIYFRTSKEKKMTFLSLFDSANVVDCYRRSESVAPQQALALANSTLTLVQSRILAASLWADQSHAPSVEATSRFVETCFAEILGRPATPQERDECLQFLTRQSSLLDNSSKLTPFATSSESPTKPSADPNQRARENLVHVLLNHHEFVTIR
ncbi:MAG: hypothetical protein RIS70_3739 [Planctomycetota bacterium]